MESVVERFLRYVSFDTQSDEASETCPSTPRQKALGAALVAEMGEMGIMDAGWTKTAMFTAPSPVIRPCPPSA